MACAWAWRHSESWTTLTACWDDEQVHEAKLTEKNRGMIIDTSDEIIELCQHAVEENNEEKRTRIAAGETLTNAQKSKAVLVAYRNVGNINAETVLSRVQELKILYEYLHPLSIDEMYQWPIPVDNIRPTLNWSCKWSATDDSMLLVGAFMHGFGNWELIQKDERLGLQGKFFLEESKKGEGEEGEENHEDGEQVSIPHLVLVYIPSNRPF